MPIPGLLTLEIFNKETQIIINEAAVDQDNKLVILRDEPKITLPLGGSIEIDQLINYAYAEATDPQIVSLIQTGERAGDGLYEFLIKDTNIPDHNAALTIALNNLISLGLFQYSHDFTTQNENFEVGQRQHFSDPNTGIDYIGLVTTISREVEASNGVDQIITSQVNVAVYRVLNNIELIQRVYSRVLLGRQELKVQLTP